ncbi:MAG: response regulator [Rickettsiales bacterium]
MSDSDTILIVNGDEAQARILETAINNRLKYNTMIVTSGQKAINAVLPVNCVPSIMLLDMGVLQIDAIHVVNIVKHCKPDFPIIIMIEYGETETAVEAIDAGANDFLTKPLTIERLGLSIENALRTRNLYKIIERLEKQLEVDGGAQIASAMYVSQTLLAGDGTVKKLRHLEEDAIRYALNACGGSMSKAARSLGIGRSTLYRKVSELGRHKKQGHIARENQATLPTIITSDNELSYVE